jgi:hypothetical protein
VDTVDPAGQIEQHQPGRQPLSLLEHRLDPGECGSVRAQASRTHTVSAMENNSGQLFISFTTDINQDPV